tara:strand:- start:122 stop:604 length:483 start_codon:yes stop_codon:yes gene_type:complete
MKTITINVYSFDELSDSAKDKARSDYRKHDVFGYIWWNESFNSLKAFCKHFNVEIKDYEVSTYRHSWVKTDANNQKFRGLKLKAIARDYMPTGYCMDCSLWMTFYDVFKLTGNALQAFNNALDQWVKDVILDIEYQDSDEVIDQNMICNNYEFDQNGVLL